MRSRHASTTTRLRFDELEDRRTPATINVTPVFSPTLTHNDYTVIQDAVNAANDGDVIVLAGTFNFSEANALASWASGSNAVDPFDNYSVYVPDGLTNLTITANSLGDAVIQGPGDLPTVDLESFLYFEGVDYQGTTVSNLDIREFDIAIGMFSLSNDAFEGSTISGNRIRLSSDLNGEENPVDANGNMAIHYGAGQNQSIIGNLIEVPGNGVSGPTTTDEQQSTNPEKFSTSIGMQSDAQGPTAYDGLTISGNTIRVLNVQSSRPERLIGIWENGHAHGADITVTNNTFLNAAADNDADLNRQQAFWVTSHSTAGSTVTYSGNTIAGFSVGFYYVSGLDFSQPGNRPVQFTGNTLTGVESGFLVQSNGLATLSGNTLTGTGAGGTEGYGVRAVLGSIVDLNASVNAGSISGFPYGIVNENYGTIDGASITGNGIGVLADGGYVLVQNTDLRNNLVAGLQVQLNGRIDAGQVTSPADITSLGVSVGFNNFAGGYAPGGAHAIVNANEYPAVGPDGSPFDVEAENNFFAVQTPAFIESVILHEADDPSRGFVDAIGTALTDVGVTAEFVTDPAFIGQQLTLLVRVTNSGSSPAVNVVTETALPPGATFVAAQTSQGTVSQAGAVVTAFLGTLQPGESAVVRITVEPTVTGELSASTLATADGTDQIPVNDSAVATVAVTDASGGVVTVKRTGGKLVITGDNENNAVQVVAGAGANSFRVIGLGGTQVLFAGSTGDDAEVSNVTKGISGLLSGGDDTFIVDGSRTNAPLAVGGTVVDNAKLGDDTFYLLHVATTGNVTSNGGTGNDRAIVGESSVGKTLSWKGVGGDDSFNVTDSAVTGTLSGSGGTGSDTFDVDATTVGKKLSWVGGTEDDAVTVTASTVTGATSLRGGAGIDLTTIDLSTFSGTFAWTGDGDGDTLSIGGTNFSGKFTAKAGSGNDTVTVDTSSFARSVLFDGGSGSDTLDADAANGNEFDGTTRIVGFETTLS